MPGMNLYLDGLTKEALINDIASLVAFGSLGLGSVVKAGQATNLLLQFSKGVFVANSAFSLYFGSKALSAAYGQIGEQRYGRASLYTGMAILSFLGAKSSYKFSKMGIKRGEKVNAFSKTGKVKPTVIDRVETVTKKISPTVEKRSEIITKVVGKKELVDPKDLARHHYGDPSKVKVNYSSSVLQGYASRSTIGGELYNIFVTLDKRAAVLYSAGRTWLQRHEVYMIEYLRHIGGEGSKLRVDHIVHEAFLLKKNRLSISPLELTTKNLSTIEDAHRLLGKTLTSVSKVTKKGEEIVIKMDLEDIRPNMIADIEQFFGII